MAKPRVVVRRESDGGSNMSCRESVLRRLPEMRVHLRKSNRTNCSLRGARRKEASPFVEFMDIALSPGIAYS